MIDIALLAHTGPCKRFSAGEHIPCSGITGSLNKEMYILLNGRVDVYKASAAGGMQTIGSVLPGDVFGGREFFTEFDEFIYTAGVDSITFIISVSSFDELSWTHPDILFEVLRAAYIPLRKVTAAQKSEQSTNQAARANIPEQSTNPAARANIPEQSTSPAARSNIPEQSTSPAARSKETMQPGTLPVQHEAPGQPDVSRGRKNNSVLSVMVEENGIFPVGHKPYPGITKPEYAQLVFSKEYICPFCKKPFTDFKVFRSKLYESSPIRFDLRRHYNDFQAEWYDVITCHNCFFSTIYNYFTEPKPVQKILIESKLDSARASILIDFDAEREIDYVFTSHYLALMCADGYLSLGRQIRAKLWGNLSWLYEDVEDGTMAKFAAGKAADAYETVYKETNLTPVQEQITCLSIAGMQYRAGVDKNLKKFLFTAKTIKMGDKTYAKIAEDFMYELGGKDG